MNYDAILVVSFGGPESSDDVIPFLENVLRGKNVPRERMLAVAEHYYHFDGKSPINQQTRDLIAALKVELAQHGPQLPVYWGNRNWQPMLAEALAQMKPIKAPTLVIWGMRDRHIGSELAEPAPEWVPNVRVERIAEATHWVQHDAAARVNELLLGFFDDTRS